MPDDYIPVEFRSLERHTTFIASDNASTFRTDLEEAVQDATERGFKIEFIEQRTTPRGQYSGATYSITIIWVK